MVPLPNGIAQDSDSFDLHFNNVARLHCSGLCWCSSIDDVAREQRNKLAYIADHCRDVEEHVTGSLKLPDLSIDTALQQKVAVVKPLDDRRPKRTKSIGRLCPKPLHIILLPDTFADVIACGDTEDVCRNSFFRHLACSFSHDDYKLSFVMHIGGSRGNDNRFVGADDARRQFQEYCRINCRRPLAQVAFVVPPDRDDL